MSAVLRITDLDLPEGVTHKSSDWQLTTADDTDFSDPVAESKDDEVHLTQIYFDVVLDPKLEYIARSRVRLSTGFTKWGNVDVFTPKDIDEIDMDRDIPSIVTLPQITLTDDVNNFPLTGFDIKLSGFNTVTNAVHYATSVIIEELNKGIIWKDVLNDANLYEFSIKDVILKPNTTYRVRAMYHSTSEDSSVLATKTITTLNSPHSELVTDLSNVNVNDKLTINIAYDKALTSTEWVIYNIDRNSFKEVYRVTKDNEPEYIIIDANTLQSNTFYMLAIKNNIDGKKSYNIFKTI